MFDVVLFSLLEVFNHHGQCLEEAMQSQYQLKEGAEYQEVAQQIFKRQKAAI